MNYLGEKVAYLKGLAEGLKVDENTNEGKLLTNIIDVLGDFVEAIRDMDDMQIQLSDHVDNIDDDLAQLESEVYEEYDMFDDYEDFGDFEDDIDYYEINCPHCNETVYLDEDMVEDDEENEIICPNCKEPIEIEIDCGCCDNHDYDE